MYRFFPFYYQTYGAIPGKRESGTDENELTRTKFHLKYIGITSADDNCHLFHPFGLQTHIPFQHVDLTGTV